MAFKLIEAAQHRRRAVNSAHFVVDSGTAFVYAVQNNIDCVLGSAESIAQHERPMVAALREGAPISQVMGRSYETMLRK